MGVESFDQGFWNFVQSKRKPWLDPELVVVSFLARPQFLAALAVVVAIFFLYRGRLAEAGLILGSCLGSFLVAILLGWLIDRPPPEVRLRSLEEPLTTSSFPSRETMMATATYLAIVLAVRPALGRRLRRVVLLAGIVLVGLTALCRAFIGSNYPTDVLAGAIGGLAWVMLCYLTAQPWLNPAPVEPARELAPPA